MIFFGIFIFHIIKGLFLFKLAAKIKYEQRFLDDELRSHIKELVDKVAHVPSDEEDGDDKENQTSDGKKEMPDDDDADEDGFETSSEDEESKPKLKTSNQNDEPMELT